METIEQKIDRLEKHIDKKFENLRVQIATMFIILLVGIIIFSRH